MKLLLADDTCRGSSNSSGARVGRFLGGSWREVRRKLRKDVFPDLRAPITRMLLTGVGLAFLFRVDLWALGKGGGFFK